MRRGRGGVAAGWTRIGRAEFTGAIMAAIDKEPDLIERLRRAIKITAARRRVEPEIVTLYLGFLSEVEMAISAMAEAERSTAASTASTPSVR